MEHYYTRNPEVVSREREIKYTLKGHTVSLVTDNGVFSKGHVDYATNFMLETIWDEIKGDVLDLGCGYGIVGMMASYCKQVTSVTMCDVNLRALDLAQKNAQKNAITSLKIVESDGFSQITDSFDTIITNPPIHAGKTVLYQMYEDGKNHLKEGGTFYLVINKKHGAPSTITFLESLFTQVEVLDKKAGFHVIRCRI